MITEDQNKTLREEARNMVRDALKAANALQKPHPEVMFDDVYESIPPHIQEQKEQLRAHLRKYPKEYNLENFKGGEDWAK